MKKTSRFLSFVLVLLLLLQTLLLTGCQLPYEEVLSQWLPFLGEKDPEGENNQTKDPVADPTKDPDEDPDDPGEDPTEDPTLEPPVDYDFERIVKDDGYYITSATSLPEGVSLSDAAIYDDILNKWQEYLVGSLDGYETPYPAIVEKIKSRSDDCKIAWDLFKSTYKAGAKDGVFMTIEHKDGNAWTEDQLGNVRKIYIFILDMAYGYKTPGTDYYGNEALLSDIKLALAYMYDNFYGTNVKNLTSGTQGNWWYWDIGFPIVFSDIYVIMKDELSQEDLLKYLKPFDVRNPLPSETAANKVWITYSILASAALQKDGKRIIESKNAMMDVFNFVTSSDGFYTDGSFIQHRAQPSSGSYGISLLETLSEVMIALSDSRFAFRGETVDNQYFWALEGLRPLVFNGLNMAASTSCREVVRESFSEYAKMRALCAALTKMSVYAPEEYLPKIKSFLRTCMKASDSDFTSSVSLYLSTFLIGLDADDSIPLQTGYTTFKVYGEMDRVVQHNANYGVCVAMSSSRIAKYEALNNENKTGWYQGDGMIYIYTDGFDYNYNYFSKINTYRLPGTTVSTMTRKEENLSNSNLIYGSSSFAGGVECGNYGIAAFTLSYKENKSYKNQPVVSGNKSYFMFDKEIVCLGSGIQTSSEGELITVVENRSINEGDTFAINGQEVNLLATKKVATANSAYFSGMGGYVFLKNSVSLTYQKTSRGFLEMWLTHDTSKKANTYSYVYLPEATLAETTAYAASPNVTVKDCNSSVHCVSDKSTGMTGYVFFAAGTASDGTTATKPCAVSLYRENGKYIVAISDPTQSASSITVTMSLNPSVQIDKADDGITATANNGTVTIKLTPKGSSGETYKVSLKQ